MFLLQLICLYKLPSCCLWKKLTQHLLGVFLVLLSPVTQCSLCLVGRWPQLPSSIPEFPENDASETLQRRRWRILITFLKILFFHTTIMFSEKEKWIQICIFFMGLLGVGPWRKEFILHCGGWVTRFCQWFQTRRIMPLNFCLSVCLVFP